MGIEIIAAIIATLVSAVLGLVTSKRLFRKKKFSIKNGIELLLLGKPELWNELRINNPNWFPDLTSITIKDLDLSNCDFRELTLDNSLFENARLEGCKFDKTSLKGVIFKNCILTDSTFFEADLSGANLENSILERINVKNANLDSSTGLENIVYIKPKTDKSIIEIVKNNFDEIDKLSPIEFENLVAQLFQSYGYEAELTPPFKDGGYDIFLKKKDIFGDINIIVEVKKYRPDRVIGLSVLRSLAGAMQFNKISKGILVTTSNISTAAKNFESDYSNISIIDRMKLKEMINNIESRTLPNS